MKNIDIANLSDEELENLCYDVLLEYLLILPADEEDYKLIENQLNRIDESSSKAPDPPELPTKEGSDSKIYNLDQFVNESERELSRAARGNYDYSSEEKEKMQADKIKARELLNKNEKNK